MHSPKFEKTQKRFVVIVINLANFVIKEELIFVSIDASHTKKKKNKKKKKKEKKVKEREGGTI